MDIHIYINGQSFLYFFDFIKSVTNKFLSVSCVVSLSDTHDAIWTSHNFNSGSFCSSVSLQDPQIVYGTNNSVSHDQRWCPMKSIGAISSPTSWWKPHFSSILQLYAVLKSYTWSIVCITFINIIHCNRLYIYKYSITF